MYTINEHTSGSRVIGYQILTGQASRLHAHPRVDELIICSSRNRNRVNDAELPPSYAGRAHAKPCCATEADSDWETFQAEFRDDPKHLAQATGMASFGQFLGKLFPSRMHLSFS